MPLMMFCSVTKALKQKTKTENTETLSNNSVLATILLSLKYVLWGASWEEYRVRKKY